MGFEWDEVKNSLDKKMSETKIVQIKIFANMSTLYLFEFKELWKNEDGLSYIKNSKWKILPCTANKKMERNILPINVVNC